MVAPTALYEMLLEIFITLGVQDKPTISILIVAFYTVLAYVLTVLVYENVDSDKKLITTLMDLLTGGIIFLVAYQSWPAIFYIVVAPVIVMSWHRRSIK
ncbi:TPA: hypothetical protein PKT84_002344 [Acinetobacter baumannii]|uniref:hypothetical protein n=1 Tax=Acinetobacter baumannii TaxID=470 RepID=UPI00034C28AF|nr:hypothetical protein [Acinetobacter baumannii]MBS4737527.1 hypothetical protein [Acinetobacter baumannii]MCH1775422.1 hypothetical protein [Acinetobacter baumannii]MCR0004667.1 hypothetical protein [Acinetobacter baumannii]HCQ9654375.1 hypothetical protein [Acinetobacter baumannii]HDI2491696.1 hypothetical protein [Acinetobacter baumannii]